MRHTELNPTYMYIYIMYHNEQMLQHNIYNYKHAKTQCVGILISTKM